MRWFPLGVFLFVASVLLVPASVDAANQSKMRVAVSVSRGCSIDVADEPGADDALVVVECGRRGVEPVVTTDDVDAEALVELDGASEAESTAVLADGSVAEEPETYTVVTIQF